jgi:hypothetical protein
MGCQISTNQAPQQPTTVLPANLPQTQADWSRFIQRMQEMLSAIRAAGYTTGVNAIPTQYSVYDGTALPGLRLTGATASLDNANAQFGVASIKLVATGTQIVLTLAATGYPATIHPYWKWIASLYCRTDQASLSGTLAVATAANAYSDDISGPVTALTWSRLYGNYDLTADASTAATLTLTLNTVVGATYWLEAWQLEPVQGDTSLPSPFIITSPPRTWGQVVNDGNKPADGADVTGAVTGTPVYNPKFVTDTSGWTFDTAGSGEWYRETGSNSPDASTGTYLLHKGVTGQTTTCAHNTGGGIAVKTGQVVTVTVGLRSVGANAGSRAYARIGWYDKSGAYITNSTQGVTICTSDTGSNYFSQGVSRVTGIAPTNAVRAIVEIEYDSHTSGYFSATSCTIAALPASLDEVPDGPTFVRRMQSVGSGAAWDIDNALFQVATAGSFTVPGWVARAGCTIYSQSSSPAPSVGTNYLVLQTTSGAANSVDTAKSFPVVVGDKISISGLVNALSGAATSLQVNFYSSTGSFVGQITTSTVTAAAWTPLVASGTVPSGAAVGQATLHSAGGGAYYSLFNFVQVTVNDVRVAGSGAKLGNQLNAPNSLTLNYGAVRSATALTATSAGAVSVNAFTYYMGAASVSYSAVSNAVTGLSQSSTYNIYTHDASGTGGAKTWQATSNVNTLLQTYDDIVVAGQVTIPTSGSSGGGGTGGCPVVDAWVIRKTSSGQEFVRAGSIRAGDFILKVNGEWGCVIYSERKWQPCVRVVAGEERALSCSRSAPLGLVLGGSVLAPDAARYVLNQLTVEGASAGLIERVDDIPEQWVQHITCENDFYWVGDHPTCLFSHHNLKP